MGANDIAVRFTENNYATKNEVSRELKISIIDGVWDKILSYRAPFCHYLSVRNIDKNQLRVCLCPTISARLNTVEAKLLRIVSEANKLDSVNSDRQYYRQSCIVKALQNIALANVSLSDEEHVRAVILGTVRDPKLSRYLDALNYVKDRHVNSINDDFLAELYSKVTGNNELTSFYRTKDLEDSNVAAVVSRVYKSAPAQMIESMMDYLFNFVEKSTVSPLCRSLISYYYIQFVKPFPEYNNEIAVLFSKAVLAHYSLGEFAIYVPLETILNENETEISKIFNDVQSSSDVTYFLNYALKFINKEFDKMLDSLAEYSTKVIKEDFFRLDEEEVKEEPVPQPEPAPAPAPVVEEKKPEPVREPEPVKEESVPAPVKPVEEKKVEVKTSPVVEKQSELAVSYIPEELDEKTAQRLERHLLELDVRLKKGQAYFYARHCTLGMYYTIEQYRKAVKCVYETARTSMDKLAEYGYYEKTLVGKKFVYTPVKRKWELKHDLRS